MIVQENNKKQVRKFTKKMQKKLAVVFIVIVLALIGLNIRISFINAKSGEKYARKVLEQQQYDSRTIPYKRGDIVDRNGTKVALSEKVYNVILDAKVMLSEKKYKEPTIAALVKCFDLKEEDIRKQLDENPTSRYIILKKKVSRDKAKAFEAIAEDKKTNPNINGVWLEDNYIRKYPYNSLASDLIGFTSDGNVGNGGIEGYYNKRLNGTDGREYGYFNDDAELERTVKQPRNGNTIVSTIDVNLQSIVEKHIKKFNDAHKNEVREGLGSDNTGVIIMDPNTGEVLANASYPNFNLNKPRNLDLLYTKEQQKKMSDKDKLKALNELWKNYSVSFGYEPGSTAKPFTVAAGLESGRMTGNEHYNCNGVLKVGDHDIHCSHKNGHGYQTVGQSIANSCNVALMEMGMQIKKDVFTKYQNIFGLGQKTGIDLPGEEYGLLYSKDKMGITDLATNSFGQNFTSTMYQIVSGFSSVINGGNYYKPHVVKQVLDEDGNVIENKDPVLLRQTVSNKTSDTLKKYLRETVVEGTGKTAAVPGYDLGGKTGTAEKVGRNKKDYLVSFIGYLPQDNPQIVIYVVIDRPNVSKQDDSKLATILTHDILEEALPYLNIFPTNDKEAKAAEAEKKKQEGTDKKSSDTKKKDNSKEDDQEEVKGEVKPPSTTENGTTGVPDGLPEDNKKKEEE